MLKQNEVVEIRNILDSSLRPMFLFDDDPDGLCSFLLLYRYVHEGIGLVVKNPKTMIETFVRRIDNYSPDALFILDVAQISQDFIDELRKKTQIPIVIIDHHDLVDLKEVNYYNPKKYNDDKNPVAYICYKIVNQDLWLSVAGTVSDWVIHPDIQEFDREFPDLIDPSITNPGKAIFDTRLGELIRYLFFILKGESSKILQSIKTMTRIQSPYEILDKTSPAGKFIWKRANKFVDSYNEIIADIEKKASSSKVLVYRYDNKKTSFSALLSNEIIYRHPDKVIVIARLSDGVYKCSMRGNKDLPKLLNSSLIGLDGSGGGHLHAVGACIKESDFDKFIEALKKNVNMV